jgi:RNA polymerase sigma-70 factor (ECF subfamily)
MLRAQAGDTEAFETLQRRYASRVYGYFCRQLKDRSDAEDLTQEVFLRLYRSRCRYSPRARFATWIFHITQNVARNALRNRRRRPCVQLNATAEHDSSLSARGEDPAVPVEREEVVDVVRAAVAELVGRQRTALELHQFQDRTYAEVAEELDMTPKAAKSLLYRARNQLRVSLAPFMA